MEKNFFNTDDIFEQLLKEKADEFRMVPSRRVWRSIYNDLHPSRKWPSIAVCLVITAVLVFVGYENSGDNSNNNTASAQNKFDKNNRAALNNNPAEDLRNKTGNSLTDISLTEPKNGPSTAANTDMYSRSGRNRSGDQNNSITSFIIDLSSRQNNNPITENGNWPVNNNPTVSSITRNNTSAASPQEQNIAMAEENEVSDNTDIFSAEKTIAGIATAAANVDVKKTETASNKNNNSISKEDKAWMEAYALHNKSARKKWKDRASIEMYITPSVGYRTLSSNTKYPVMTTASGQSFATGSTSTLNHVPSLSAEVGASMIYAFAKKLRIKAGVQFNYSRYGIKAYSTNHPVITTLALNDLNSGYPYLDSRSTTYSNLTGDKSITLHNSSVQVSLPVGLDVKIAGQEKIQWYAGATIQPTFIINSKSYLPSSDKNNYVADKSMVRKLSVNAGFETFISYKMNNGLTLQAGPQLRLQIPSTYGKKFTMDEKLINAGLKIGLVRNF